MLCERIHQTRKDLADNNIRLFRLHLELSTVLSPGHWDLVDSLSFSASEAVRDSVRSRHENKYWRDSPEAVSYTHLDVYKRQDLSWSGGYVRVASPALHVDKCDWLAV